MWFIPYTESFCLSNLQKLAKIWLLPVHAQKKEKNIVDKLDIIYYTN